MVTTGKEDLKESSPFSIECWVCEEARKKAFRQPITHPRGGARIDVAQRNLLVPPMLAR